MSTDHEPTARPRPRITPDNARFWEGCRERRLLLPTCESCGAAHLPPGPVCPFCWSEDLVWRRARGTGRVASRVVVHRSWFPAFADRVPYDVTLVELDEGPRITSTIVDGGADPIGLGRRVVVAFEDIDSDLVIPVFRLTDG